MKRIERQHLKENDLATRLESMRDYIEPRTSSLGKVAVVLLLAVLAVVGISMWRERQATRGDRALAEALVALNAQVVPAGVAGEEGLPAAAQLGAQGTFSTEAAKLNAALPKLKTAADEYPDTDAGIQARYHMAGALAALGRHDEAIKAFEEVTDRAGDESLYGRMARLGKADAQAKAGQLDAAIASWKEMAAEEVDELPADAILMDLARAYVQKGNTEEARKALTEIVDKHSGSPYAAEARAELENLKG
jgi:predicted negative regulator of RcsB-dependent stress response